MIFIISVYDFLKTFFKSKNLRILFCILLLIYPSTFSLPINIELYLKYLSLGFAIFFITSFLREKYNFTNNIHLLISIGIHPLGIVTLVLFLVLISLYNIINSKNFFYRDNIRIYFSLFIIFAFKLIFFLIGKNILGLEYNNIYVDQITELNSNIKLILNNTASILFPKINTLYEYGFIITVKFSLDILYLALFFIQ